MCSSPSLIAAYHGLLRRAAPRHPPYALSRLTISYFTLTCFFSKKAFPFPMIVKEPARDSFRHRTILMGQNRVELLTPSLSEKCSNRLSYWPKKKREEIEEK